jgi:tRNA threonylcarbamoyladenosine biosynthesis protein TsaB
MRAVLGIDTASRHGSVALAIDGVSVAHCLLDPGGHSSQLSTAAESLLASRDLGWRDLACVAVAEGPGSFTGLRVGLAWAKGLVLGLGVPLALVPSHQAHARAARARGASLVTVLPGERGFFQAAFWEGGADAALLWGPVSIPEKELADTLLGRAEGRPGTLPRVAAPELPSALAEALAARGLVLLEPEPLAPQVAELGDRSLREGRLADPVSAAPSYGRAPNARKPAR